MILTSEFLRYVMPRKTQIFAAEAIVALMAPLFTPELLVAQDCTWYVDNEAAVSSLIRGTSRTCDVGHIAAASQLLFLQLQTRVWWEWVDTKSNPADGLSRAGTLDAWTAGQGWDLVDLSAHSLARVQQF